MTGLRRSATRPGFALITVLWVTVVLAVVGTTASAVARDELLASRNRVLLERARWLAALCVARAQTVVDEALASAPDPFVRAERWRSLDFRVEFAALRGTEGCELRLAAEGDALDVNHASERALLIYFGAVGLGPDRLDLAQALLDWRDADDTVREHGAEQMWYRVRGQVSPRNGPLGDPAELRLIRGLEALSDEALAGLATTGARISVNTAPREVLATIPGFGQELIDRVRERAARGEPVHDLLALPQLVTGEASERVREFYPAIVQAATVDPEAWLLAATTRIEESHVSVTLEARLLRSADGTIVSSWRVW